jgi:hypothetical protein
MKRHSSIFSHLEAALAALRNYRYSRHEIPFFLDQRLVLLSSKLSKFDD